MERIEKQGGTYLCEVTTAHTGKTFSQLTINVAATFTTLTITDKNGTTYNALLSTGQYGQNLAGISVIAGQVISAPVGSYFSALTMSSGNCLATITRNP